MNLLNKKFLTYSIIGSLLLLISMGALWYYLSLRPYDAWNLIPNQPIVIVETSQALQTYQELEKQPFWNGLQTTNFFGVMSERMNVLKDKVLKIKGFIDFLNDKKLTISLHIISKEEIDFLFYLPIKTSQDEVFLKQIIKEFENDSQFQFRKRSLRNLQINEVAHTDLNGVFSYILHHNFLIASYSPVLIEDVTRKISMSEKAFAFNNQSQLDKQIFQTQNLANKLSIYLHTKQIAEFLNLTAKSDFASFFKPIAYFANNIALHSTQLSNPIKLSGLSYTTEKDSSTLLNIFKNQTPQAFQLQNIIPNQTAVLYHSTFSKTKEFFQSLVAYEQRENSQFLKNKKAFEQIYQKTLDGFYQHIDKEIAYCILESNNARNANKLLFLKSKSLGGNTVWLNEVAKKAASKAQTSFFSEQYGSYTIQEIKIQEFPALLLGNLYKGFEKCYFTTSGQAVVFANEASIIKTWINNLKNKEVWDKSSLQRNILKNLKTPANLNVVVLTDKVWNFWNNIITETWQEILLANEAQWKSVNWFSMQFANNGKDFKTNFIFHFGDLPMIAGEKLPENYRQITQATFKQAIHTKPFLVKNHQDNSEEVLVQDVVNNLCLLSPEGKAQWFRKIDSPIRNEPIQIDIYDNDRLQYVLLTNNRLHLIDRVGRNVPGFPIYIVDADSSKLNTLSVFDFENNGKNHFLTSTERGKLYMLDNNRKFVTGWRPKKLNYPLGSPAQDVKIAGKNYIIAVQKNGLIHVLDLSGNEQAGFPLELPSNISNPLHIAEGLDLESTIFTCFTDNGELVQFNLLGQKLKEEQLYRPSANSKFQLCMDKKSKDWILAVTDAGYIGILGKTGERLFETKFENKNDNWEVQYFDLNTNLKILAITDKIAAQTYFYDLIGRNIGEPIQSSKAVEIKYKADENELIIYRTYLKVVGSLSLKLR